jgi:site-specific recombinase XerD
LRHQHAVLALRSGAPLKAISGRLGHAGLSSTEVYLHYLQEDDAGIAGWLETRFGENKR